MGISAYLTKPVKPSELLAVICAACGRTQAGGVALAPPIVDADANVAPALDILLVEDNPISSRVAHRW